MAYLPWRIKELDWIGLGGQSTKSRKKEKERKKQEEARKQREEAQFNEARDLAFQDLRKVPLPSQEDIQAVNERTKELSDAESARAKEAREGFKQEALADINTPVGGLTPQQRNSMQESANRQIGGHLQNYSQMLASSQGSRGVRGGKAQADLRRRALDAQNQVTRDLNQQDTDLSMQRLAAYLNAVEGRSAQDLLQRQQYRDFLLGEQERRRNAARDLYYDRFVRR